MANTDMMDLQPELEWYMRPYLVDFLVEVHAQFRMSPVTLHLAINLVDRYTSKRVVFKKHFQLVGCAALWIAAKFEDSKDRVPTVRELRQMCCNAYDEDMFVQMEGHVLTTLGWEIGFPTTDSFIQLATAVGNTQFTTPTIHMARFITELSLFYRDFLVFPASVLAAAALTLAKRICGCTSHLPSFIDELVDSEVVDCVKHFLNYLPAASAILTKKYASKSLSDTSDRVAQYLTSLHDIDASLPDASDDESQSTSALTTPIRARPTGLKIDLPQDITTPPQTPAGFVQSILSQVTARSASSACSVHMADASGLPTPPFESKAATKQYIHKPSYENDAVMSGSTRS